MPRRRDRRFLSAETDISKFNGERLFMLGVPFNFPTQAKHHTSCVRMSKTQLPKEQYILTYAVRITQKLNKAFSPSHLEVIDESEQHRGHGGYRDGGETHFKVILKSAAMNGLNRVARQRAVYAVLKEELAERVHALALQIDGED